MSIDFPLCSRDDQEWFSVEFRVWRDTRDPSFVFNLSSPVSAKLPLPGDVLRDYTLEFKIRVERAFMDLREYLRKVVRDRDCCRELDDTLMEDIEEMSSAHKSELATLRAKLDWRGPTPPITEVKCVHLRSQVVGLEDELADLTQRLVALDHTWVEERAVLEADRAETRSGTNCLALELVQVKAYIHSILSMEYGQEGDGLSKP